MIGDLTLFWPWPGLLECTLGDRKQHANLARDLLAGKDADPERWSPLMAKGQFGNRTKDPPPTKKTGDRITRAAIDIVVCRLLGCDPVTHVGAWLGGRPDDPPTAPWRLVFAGALFPAAGIDAPAEIWEAFRVSADSSDLRERGVLTKQTVNALQRIAKQNSHSATTVWRWMRDHHDSDIPETVEEWLRFVVPTWTPTTIRTLAVVVGISDAFAQFTVPGTTGGSVGGALAAAGQYALQLERRGQAGLIHSASDGTFHVTDGDLVEAHLTPVMLSLLREWRSVPLAVGMPGTRPNGPDDRDASALWIFDRLVRALIARESGDTATEHQAFDALFADAAIVVRTFPEPMRRLAERLTAGDQGDERRDVINVQARRIACGKELQRRVTVETFSRHSVECSASARRLAKSAQRFVPGEAPPGRHLTGGLAAALKGESLCSLAAFGSVDVLSTQRIRTAVEHLAGLLDVGSAPTQANDIADTMIFLHVLEQFTPPDSVTDPGFGGGSRPLLTAAARLAEAAIQERLKDVSVGSATEQMRRAHVNELTRAQALCFSEVEQGGWQPEALSHAAITLAGESVSATAYAQFQPVGRYPAQNHFCRLVVLAQALDRETRPLMRLWGSLQSLAHLAGLDEERAYAAFEELRAAEPFGQAGTIRALGDTLLPFASPLYRLQLAAAQGLARRYSAPESQEDLRRAAIDILLV